MSRRPRKMSSSNTVAIRELRQNLSKYLRRVARGESFRVSDRGRAVAALTPLPEDASPVERLAAEGRLVPARLDLLSLGPPVAERLRQPVSEALDELRAED